MKLDGNKFKRLTGIKKSIATLMVNVLRAAYEAKHVKGGRKAKLAVEEMLMMALEYWRQYVTFFELGAAYGVAESTAHDIVVWVENVLIKSGQFKLPGKKNYL